jgi:hypothetical protein
VLLLKEGSALLKRTKRIFAAYDSFDNSNRRRTKIIWLTAVDARRKFFSNEGGKKLEFAWRCNR